MITIKERSFAVSQMGVPTTTRVLNASDFDWDWAKIPQRAEPVRFKFQDIQIISGLFSSKKSYQVQVPSKKGAIISS